MWEGEEEKEERRKTTAACEEIQHCQEKATVMGRIYFLEEGFPISLVTQGRRKNIILKNTGLAIKLRLLGGRFPSDAAAILPSCMPFHHPPAKDEFRPA